MKFYLYGAGRNGKKIFNLMKSFQEIGQVEGFVESNPKWNGITFCDRPVYSLDNLLSLLDEESLVILTPDLDVSIKIAEGLKARDVKRYVYWNYIEKIGLKEAFEMLVKEDANGIANRSLIFENEVLSYQVKFLMDHIEPSSLKPASDTERKKQLDLVKLAADFQDSMKQLGISLFLVAGNLLGYVRHNAQFIPWDDDLDLAIKEDEFNLLEEFCQETFPFYRYNGDYDNNLIYKWYDEMVDRHPGEIIVLATPLLFRVYRNQDFIDILPLRSYADDLTYEEHSQFLDIYRKRMANCATSTEQLELKSEVLKKDSEYMRADGRNWTYSPLTWEAYYGNTGISQWFVLEDIFPLQKITFENEDFFAPKNIDAWLRVEFGDNYMSLPKNLGLHIH